MAEKLNINPNEDPVYRKKVYKFLADNFSDFTTAEQDFYKKLDTDQTYAPKVYKLLKDNFSDFDRGEQDFMFLMTPSKKKDQAGLPAQSGESVGTSQSPLQLPSADPNKSAEDNVIDLGEASKKAGESIYTKSQSKISSLTKDYEDYVNSINQQIKDGVIVDRITAEGLIGHKRKRYEKAIEEANAEYQASIDELNNLTQEERKKILNPKNRKTTIDVGDSTSEGENAKILNEYKDLEVKLNSIPEGDKSRDIISQELKNKKKELAVRLGIEEDDVDMGISGNVYSDIIGSAPKPEEIREYAIGIRNNPVNASQVQLRRKAGQLFYENTFEYFHDNPKAATRAFSETFMDQPDQLGVRKPSQYDFELNKFMIETGKQAVRGSDGVVYNPENAAPVDVSAIKEQYNRNLKGLSQQLSEKFIKLTPSSDDLRKLQSGEITEDEYRARNSYENIVKNIQKQYELIDNYVLNQQEKQSIREHVGNQYTYLADVLDKFGGKTYREKNPLYVGLNDYQKIYLEKLKISNPEKYDGTLRLLTTPAELIRQETGKWNPELESGYQGQMKEAEDAGIKIASLDYQDRISGLVSKSKERELTSKEKLELAELTSGYEELEKFKSSQVDRYPVASKQEIIDLIGKAGGGVPMGGGERFLFNIGRGISSGVDWAYELITSPLSNEDSRITDLQNIGDDNIYRSKVNVGWEEEGVTHGDLKYALDPEFNKQIRAIDQNDKLSEGQKYGAKVKAFLDYRKAKGEDPVVITKNERAGDLNLTVSSVSNVVGDVGSQIISQFALAAMTGGAGNISKARSLATLFGTTFATSMRNYEVEALREGRNDVTSYAIRKSTIDALTELYGDDLMRIKGLFKGKGTLGKIVESVTEAEWKAALKSTKRGVFNNVKNVISSLPRRVAFPAFQETGEEVAGNILNNLFDGKPLSEGLKETIATAGIGTLGAFMIGLPFQYRSITNSQKMDLFNAGLNADKFLKSIESDLANGTITQEEAEKRRLVINDANAIVRNLPKVDENGNPLSEKAQINLAFNKYTELQAQKAKKENPKSQKIDQVIDELQEDNNAILSGEEQVVVSPKEEVVEAGEVAPETSKMQKGGAGMAMVRSINELKAEVELMKQGKDTPEKRAKIAEFEKEIAEQERLGIDPNKGRVVSVELSEEFAGPEEVASRVSEAPKNIEAKKLDLEKRKNDDKDIKRSPISDDSWHKEYGYETWDYVKPDGTRGGVLVGVEKDGKIISNEEKIEIVRKIKNAEYESELKEIEQLQAEKIATTDEVKPEVPKTVEQLRAAEQAEYAAMTDPNDEVKRQEIYDKYDKLITPLLEKEKEVSEAAPVPSIIEVKSPKEVKQGDTVVWRGEDFIVEEVNPKGGFNLRNAADRTNTVKDARITDEEFQGKRGEVAAAPKVEKFGVGFAPFREKNVFTEEEDVDIRTSPDYQLHQENVQKVAQGLGIKINNKLDTWGGYVDSETGRPVQEVSNIMEIEATPEQARVMAAILGKAAPEMQDSVLLGNYNENGVGFEHRISTGSFNNALEASKLLKENGLEYFTIDKGSGDIIILDLDNSQTNNIANFIDKLIENGIEAKHTLQSTDAEFIGREDYDRILSEEGRKIGQQTGFDIDAFVQEAAGKYDAIKAAAKPVVPETQKSIADKIRGLKIDLSKLGDGGAQSNIAGLPVALYNTVVEAVALAVEAGVSINKAINDAIKEYKLSKVKDFDKDVLAREILKGIEITEPQVNPVYFENLKKFASESSFDNKIQFKNSIQSLFAKYLPELKAKFGKDFDPSNYDERARKYLVDLVTRESLNAIKKHPEAIGWYDEKTQSALDVISAIHPEIATDAEARGAFILPLAIMSNGNKVDFNFELAEKQYQFFKDNGRFNPDGEFGLQQSGIKKSLMLINSLLDNGLTMSDINKFLTSKYRAGDLKIKIDGKVKDLASGELADEQVYGAVILGPKIGNGFYMNLWGQFDQLTMDRWFMRTWGRMTGTLIEKDAAGIAEGEKRLSKAVDEIKKDSEALAILKSLLPKISSLSIQDLAKSIEKVSMDKKKRAELSSNPKTDELRKAANSLSKNLSGEKEAPSTGKERRFIREVFTDVVNDLKNKYGIEISMADLQAALWYPEKILYESFKGGETFEAAAEGYTSDSAPDYLNAAKKLATKLGVNEEQINQALSRGRERAERIAGEGYPEGGRAISESYQDILGRVKEAIGEKPATEKVRAAAKTVRSLKIKQEGLQANIAGIPIALYNAALETIATALEAGASLTDAIREAIRKHKLNKQKDFDSDTFVKQLESVTGQTVEKIGGKYAIQIEAAGEIPVQPKAGISEEVEGGVPGAKPKAAPEEGKSEGEEEKVRVSGIKKGLVSQEVLSRVNLNTIGDKELLESGRAIIESGEVKPKTVVNRVIDGGQGVLTPAEVVAMITYKADLDTKQEDLSKEIERRTKAGEDLGDLLVEYKDLQVEIDNYDIAAVITAQQQSLAFRLRRYLLDREYNITVQINRYKQTNGGTIPESVLAKFKKLNETIKDLRKKIKEAEAVKYEEDSKAAMQNIIEDVERENQANGPKLYTEQELEDKIREGVQKEIDGIYSKMPAEKKSKAQRVIDALDNIQRKLRSKTYDASLGVPVAFIDAGITAIKNAIKLGIEVEKAIEIGIKTIKDKLNGAKWDKEADFRKDMMEGFKDEGVDVKKTKEVKAKINDDGTITIPNKDIRDFVSQGIEDIDDLADAILNKYQAELPGVSSRQVRDAITKYGKEVSQTRDDISIKLGRAKRIGRLLSELEDLRTMDKGAFLLKYQRVKPAQDKISEREKNLKYLIRQLGREIMGDEPLPDNYDEQKALDTAKNRVSRRIEELRDKIRRGDFSKKQKRRVQADQELLDLQTQLENAKSQFDLEHEKNEQKNKKWYQKAGDFVLELFSGIPRTLVTGFDLGIVLTQGIRKVFTNPRMSAKAFWEAGKQFFSESRQRRMEQELKLSGAYALIKNSGLAISEGAEKASAQEQIFIVNYVNLIWDTFSRVITLNYKPGTDFVKALNPFKASQRFFDGYLNYIRINSFLDLSNAIGKDGYMPETHPEIYKAAAEFVNTTTGKGAKNIPKSLGFLMFSASKVASELKLYTPYAFFYYAKMPKAVRKRAMLEFGTFALSFGTTMFLMRAALGQGQGDDEDDDFWDINSSNFLTFKFGNQRVSFAAGARPTLVFMGRLFSGVYVDQYGQESKLGERTGKQINTKFDLIVRFFTAKAAPVPAAAIQYLDKKAGVEVEDNVFQNLVLPMWLQDSQELYAQNPKEIGALYTLISLIGANVRTVEEYTQKEHKMPQKISYTDDYSRKREVVLTDEQKADFQKMFNEKFKKNIDDIHNSETYKKLESKNDKILFDVVYGKKAKDDAESDAKKELIRKYRGPFSEFPIIRETPEEKEINRILNRGEKR